MKICPVCEEPVAYRYPPIPRSGWSLGVDLERLAWSHRDGEPLCPEMTQRGYQPCLPIDKAE